MSKKIAVVCWVTDDYVDYIGYDLDCNCIGCIDCIDC